MTAISPPDEVYERELRQHLESRSHYEKAKSMTTVETREVDVDVEKKGNPANSAHWQPGVKARFPWLGFGAIFMVLCCIIFSIIILLSSDGSPAEEWPVQLNWQFINGKWKKRLQLTPSVALAVTNTVSNLCLAIAIGQGVAIAWWRKALKGATVTDLHKSWSFSASAVDLLTAGKNFNIVALAALAAKIALVDNILLQKAAENFPGSYVQLATVRIPTMMQQLPPSFVGLFNDDLSIGSFSGNFSNVLRDYSTSGSLVLADNFPEFIGTCNGTCFAAVPGFGFAINCTDNPATPSFKITKELALKNSWNDSLPFNSSTNDASFFLPTLLSFQAIQDLARDKNNETTVTDPQVSGINLFVSWATMVAASGDLNDLSADTCMLTNYSRSCELRPALLSYSVEIDNTGDLSENTRQIGDFVTVKSTNGAQLTKTFGNTVNKTSDPFEGNQLLSWNISVIEVFKYNSTFDMNVRAFSQMLNSMFQGDIELQYLNVSGGGYVPSSLGESGSAVGTWWALQDAIRPSQESCVMNITDPMVYIMEQLNHITFRSSMYAGYNAWQQWFKNQPTTQANDSKFHGNITAFLDSTLPKLKGNATAYLEETFDKFLSNQTAVQPFINNTEAVQFSPTTIYTTSFPFMFAAIFSMFFCAMCILPSYWGFWELGRKVTLGPMEIASAFQAPVLDHPVVATRGGEVEILLQEVGGRQVRYGEVEESGRLAVAQPEEVKKLTVPSAHPNWHRRSKVA